MVIYHTHKINTSTKKRSDGPIFFLLFRFSKTMCMPEVELLAMEI